MINYLFTLIFTLNKIENEKLIVLSSGGMGYQELELQTPITTAFLENKQLLHKNLPYDRATINKS